MRPGSQHRPTVDEFVDHIDHVATLTGGTDHIGVGTDASLGTYPEHWHDPWGEPDYPNPTAEYGARVTPDIRSPLRQVEGFSDYAEVGTLIDRLLARGYTDHDVHKILGDNYLGIFEQVWRPVVR